MTQKKGNSGKFEKAAKAGEETAPAAKKVGLSTEQELNQELHGMLKKLKGMADRCNQLGNEYAAANETAPKFLFVTQVNLQNCINHISMFSKDVE